MYEYHVSFSSITEVSCRKCGAEKGKRCKNNNGGVLRHSHATRWTDWRNVIKKGDIC